MGHFLLILFGVMFLTNAMPHLVNGLSGRAFQSPFGKPPGQGVSSSTSNVLWGGANLTIGWALLIHWGGFDLTRPSDALTALIGLLAMGVLLARTFGRFNGGNTP